MGRQELDPSRNAESSDEDQDSSYGTDDDEEELEQGRKESEPKRISKFHDMILDSLVKDKADPLLELEMGPDITASGEDDMTILHKIIIKTHRPLSKPRKPPNEAHKHSEPRKPLFETFRPLVNKILCSGDNRKFLSKLCSTTGQTALSLAASSKKWEALECLLSFEGSLDAAVLPCKQGSSNNCLHELVKAYMAKSWDSPGQEESGKFLWGCIERLVSEPNIMKRLYMEVPGLRGNTPLHLAVAHAGKISPESQEKLISKLIDAYPESMNIFNSAGQSPYQYRMQKITMKGEEGTDKITFNLKDRYMHYENRNDAAKYLYGNGGELAMELDLSEHAGYPLRNESLEALSNHLKFESILRYVDFPRTAIEQAQIQQEKPESRFKQGKRRKPVPEGIGRQDLKVVFEWLQKCGVKKIIRVRVQDSEDLPHSDEVIETALADFQIEVWDWVKIDLCSNTILNAARDVREVHLYSSGNNAVLHAWSSDDGLRRLEKLKIVHVTIYQRLESLKRTEEYAEVFKNRLRSQIKHIDVETKVEPWAGQQEAISGSPGEGSPEQTHMWITHITSFVNFIINIINDYPESIPKPKKVKVALIDDGVDGAHQILGNTIKGGVSFCSRPGFQNHVYSYCVPSGCHGTQMAGLIYQVCPEVDLYVARIQDMEVGGNRQIDAESVVKAIDWAIAQDVDIISMSWTFQRTTDNKTYLDNFLRKAISRASKKDILMFCSTGDMGKCANDEIFPACLPSVFKIGAAKPSGREREWTETFSHFMLPGEDLKAEIPTYIKPERNVPVSGSSLATALASGLAALMLYCSEVVGDHQFRESVRNYTAMERAFKNMVNPDQPKYIRAWEHLKPDFKDLPKSKRKEELKRTIEGLFK